MSDKIVMKGKKTKAPKAEVPNGSEAASAKRSRAKKAQPTNEEILKSLEDGIKELGTIISDLKEDQQKLPQACTNVS